MHARRMAVAVVALCTLFVSALLLPEVAASEEAREPKPLAEMAVGASRVDWQPAGDDERLVLTVTGPGDLFIQREFAAGESPLFGSLDVPGGRLPDGIYAYELSQGSLVQWGHLWVQGGSFVDKVAVRPGLSSQRESASKVPSNVTANTTVSDDLICEEDLIVDGHACIGNECAGAVTSAPLTIKDLFNYQILFDGGGLHPAKRNWVLQANDATDNFGGFLFRDVFAGTIPFRIGSSVPNHALTIGSSNGNVGLGTLTPSTQLHVRSTGSGGKILAENASGTTAFRELLEIRNNGGAAFILEDTSVPERWSNGTSGNSFVINNQANAGVEYTFDPTGNLTISGTLTQGSDRDSKRDIMAIRPAEILAKVANLPITTWNRKTDPSSVRHLGPMAQDFAAAFGLGDDDRHIAVLDIAGVSLASIQALNQKVTEKEAEIAELRRENEDLAERLAALEALVLRVGNQPAPDMAPAP